VTPYLIQGGSYSHLVTPVLKPSHAQEWDLSLDSSCLFYTKTASSKIMRTRARDIRRKNSARNVHQSSLVYRLDSTQNTMIMIMIWLRDRRARTERVHCTALHCTTLFRLDLMCDRHWLGANLCRTRRGNTLKNATCHVHVMEKKRYMSQVPHLGSSRPVAPVALRHPSL